MEKIAYRSNVLQDHRSAFRLDEGIRAEILWTIWHYNIHYEQNMWKVQWNVHKLRKIDENMKKVVGNELRLSENW